MKFQRDTRGLKMVAVLVAVFAALMLFNAMQRGVSTVSVTAFPSTPKPGQPVVITTTVTNTQATRDNFSTSLYVDGRSVMVSSAVLTPGQSQSFTYTTAALPSGQVLKASAFVTSASGKTDASNYVLAPNSPPEAWMSMMAFSTFAISLISSTTMLTSTFTITYYDSTMNLQAPGVASISAIDVGIFLSLLLIGMLIFVEMTDKSYGEIHPTFYALRKRYGLFSAYLLLVFIGIVLTKVILLAYG